MRAIAQKLKRTANPATPRAPRLQFNYFGLQMENNFQKHKFCCRSAVLANEMRRCASNYYRNNRT
jgi:hypothetical protein